MNIGFDAFLLSGTACEDYIGTALSGLQPFDEIIDYVVVTSGASGTATMACNYFSSVIKSVFGIVVLTENVPPT